MTTMIYIKTTQLKYDTEWFSTEQRKFIHLHSICYFSMLWTKNSQLQKRSSLVRLLRITFLLKCSLIIVSQTAVCKLNPLNWIDLQFLLREIVIYYPLTLFLWPWTTLSIDSVVCFLWMLVLPLSTKLLEGTTV